MSETQKKPKDIAVAVFDNDAQAWNVELTTPLGALVTFAALDREHAAELAHLINLCAWVESAQAR
jgi:hypothetical protein